MNKLNRLLSVTLALLMVISVISLPEISNNTVEAEASSDTVLIDLQSSWKYLDDGTDPAGSGARTSWTEQDFNDSGWKSSPSGVDAKFGSKRGALAALDDGTVPTVLLNHYLNSGNTVPTYFFRCDLTLDTAPESGTSLLFNLRYDDAVIVYINGTRVKAFHEPDGGFESNLSYGGSGGYEPFTESFLADASLLKAGENVIAVELHQVTETSSDIYFELTSVSLASSEPEYLNMSVGVDETQRNFTWYFASEGQGSVQYAVRNGNTFPSEYTAVNSTVTSNDTNYIHRATITGLLPDKEYVYRIVNNGVASKNYYFKTASSDSFNFIFVGDPQVGSYYDDKDDFSGNWSATMEKAITMFPDSSLLVSAGDQVEVGNWEKHYACFFTPDELNSLALATTIGNHDAHQMLGGTDPAETDLYSKHFNNPNTSGYGTTLAGGDYWYTYNNTLFMHLNTNSLSVAEHKAFLQEAVNANTDVNWKIVVMHHSLYGAGYYGTIDPSLTLRTQLVPVFTELGIDVVLSGHEHAYSRSYMMNEFTPDTSNGVQSSVTNPAGILYVTGTTSSASKHYGILSDAETPHSAVKKSNNDDKYFAFSNVEITDTSFKITTYYTHDGSVLDSFEIIKDSDGGNDNNENGTNLAADEIGEIVTGNKVTDTGSVSKLTDGVKAGSAYDSSDSDTPYYVFAAENAEYNTTLLSPDGSEYKTYMNSVVFDISDDSLEYSNITDVKIYMDYSRRGWDYAVEYSLDGITWSKAISGSVADFQNGENIFTIHAKDLNVNANYLRISVCRGDKAADIAVSEIEIFGTTVAKIPNSGEAVIYGDVNDDKKVNISDCILIKRSILKTYQLNDAQYLRANINKDTKVNISDYILCKRIVLKTYTAS